jgi:ankyrin repeat protein
VNRSSFLSRLFHSPIYRIAIVPLIMLALNIPAVCGEIHDAVKTGDLAKVKALLKDNPELVFSKDNGLFDATSLHLAALYIHKNIAELLLANKAEVNAKAKDGSTPLHFAAQINSKDVAELLLANGANVNARDNGGYTPLHWAANECSIDVTKLLLANKAEVSAKAKDGYTPLHFAAQMFSYKQVAELLLAKGAEVNARNADGETPLHVVVREPLKMIGLGSVIGGDLKFMLEGGNTSVVELLMDKGADVNAKDNNGKTPLREALNHGFKDIAKLLHQHGGHE